MERGWNYYYLVILYWLLVVKKKPDDRRIIAFVSDVSHFPLDIDEYIFVLIMCNKYGNLPRYSLFRYMDILRVVK